VKIVHVGWGYPPEWLGCGPVVYVHHVARAQAAAGHEVAVVCASDRRVDGGPAYEPKALVVEGVPYVHIQNRPAHMHDLWNPGRDVADPQCAEALAYVLAELGPDVVHVHNLVGLSFDAIDAARGSGAKVVTSLHNYFPLCSRDDLFFANVERCEGAAVRSCSSCLGTGLGDDPYRRRHRAGVEALNACDLVLAVSTRVAEIYRAQGVDAGRMVVDRIGSVTAEELWRTVGEGRVAGDEAPADPLRVVFFGSLTPRKGIVGFLQATRLLAHPERVRLRVHGGAAPDVIETMSTIVSALTPAQAQRLEFRGGFGQHDLAGILGDADVAVLPPRWEDNGPQTVMEAQAAGLPVVATRVGGIPDVVEDGRNGLLVDEGDPRDLAAAVDRLSGDPDLVRSLRRGISGPVTMASHRLALDGHYRTLFNGTGRAA